MDGIPVYIFFGTF